MAVSKAQKVETLAKLNDRYKRSAACVFVNFQGMTVDDTVKLRKFLVTNGIDYQIAKKTLMRLMAQEGKVADFDEAKLNGSIGIAFGYTDEVTLAKAIKSQSKQFEALKIVAGIVNGKMVEGTVINTLASLPSREELLAKLVGTMLSPLRGFVGSLQSPISGFVRALNAYSQKKTA
ncbi:MAG: 50S ribosomal protein L10 [Candidatus Abawacabacteria bacterium]|nr:50S ribosomal protein L10 [Candidatus Abawacabacteria bacterium]